MYITKPADATKSLPELDGLYVYKCEEMALEKVPQPPYRYIKDGMIEREQIGVVRYAQGITIDGNTAGLLIITKEKRKAVIAKFFKESIKVIKDDPELLRAFKEAWTVPIKMGIYL